MVASADKRDSRQHVGQMTQWGEHLREGAASLKNEATDKLNKAAAALKKEANRALEGQKEQVAEKISGVGSAIEKAGRMLHASHADSLANYVDLAAERADNLSKYLRDSDLDEMVEDAAEVTRRHRVAVYSALFLAGIAAARFWQVASSEESRDD